VHYLVLLYHVLFFYASLVSKNYTPKAGFFVFHFPQVKSGIFTGFPCRFSVNLSRRVIFGCPAFSEIARELFVFLQLL